MPGASRRNNDTMTVPLTLNPDRLFPAEPQTRAVARKLYDQIKDLPILSPHGHVPPAWIADDIPFPDPVNLLLTPDHYVNRIMHGQGVDLADLGVPLGRPNPLDAEGSRNAWRIFCKHWHLYRGTPMKFWMEAELVDVFGVDVRPSEETADQIYDIIDAKLKTDEFKPRALMDKFDIEFIATTDDPCDTLEHHQKIAADPTFTRTVAPTLRPDKYLEAARPDWNQSMDTLAQVSGVDTSTFAGWIAAFENRRAFFKANGGTSTDHSHADLEALPPESVGADALYAKARAGKISVAEATALRKAMMFEQMRMACDDGLVMTLHPAVYRNHNQATFERFGADVGGDIPMSVEVVKAMQPGLNAFGLHPNFRVIIMVMDETVISRELAPLAGFYPSVYVGPPWWFLDCPDAIKRWRKAQTEFGTFYKTCGFIDDTRAFMSIPARHDVARRCDVSHLAELVVEGRLAMDEAEQTAFDLTSTLPRKAFNIPS